MKCSRDRAPIDQQASQPHLIWKAQVHQTAFTSRTLSMSVADVENLCGSDRAHVEAVKTQEPHKLECH